MAGCRRVGENEVFILSGSADRSCLYRKAKPMSQQMSFDFPSGAVVLGPVARGLRRRGGSSGLAAGHAPQQLSLISADGARPAHTTSVSRPPLFRPDPQPAPLGDGRQWTENGWTVSVVRNQDGEGWAAQVRRDGEQEPVLLAPWATERDSLAPKPLDQAAFNQLVRMAEGTLERQAHQLQASLHKRLALSLGDCLWEFVLEVVPDEYEPHALLSAIDENGERIAQERVLPDFKLTQATARAWIEADFRHSAEDHW